MVDTGSKHRRTIRRRASQAFSATVINGPRMTGRRGSATKRRHRSGESRQHRNPVQDEPLLNRPQNAPHEGRHVIDHIDEVGWQRARTRVQASRRLMAAFNSVALCDTTEAEHAQLSTPDFYISRSKKGRNDPSTLGPAGSLRNRWRLSPASCAMWACVAVHPSR